MNYNHNHTLKNIFKGAATTVTVPGSLLANDAGCSEISGEASVS